MSKLDSRAHGTEFRLEKPDSVIMFAVMKPFEQIVTFIADSVGAERLSAFRPTKAAERRVATLLARRDAGTIRPAERRELDLFVQLDHVMSLAKAKARARAIAR